MTAIFGEPLEAVMSRANEKEKIPSFLKQTLCWLNKRGYVEGLFQVSAGVKELDNLKVQFNAGQNVNLDNYDPHLIAGLLKAYFIELPEPLLTFDLYDGFIEIGGLLKQESNNPACKQRLKALMARLPETNKLTAGCLFYYLNRVAALASETKTITQNLAIVFGQILLRPKVESLNSLISDSPKISALLKHVLENYGEVVPANREEAQLIEDLISGGGAKSENKEKEDLSKLTPEQQKLRNIKMTADDCIQVVLERLDAMSKEMNATTSLDETIEIAKKIRTAKRYLFA